MLSNSPRTPIKPLPRFKHRAGGFLNAERKDHTTEQSLNMTLKGVVKLFVFLFFVGCEAECPPFWTQWRDHCYMYIGTPAMNWREAEAYCVANEGHLASIHSEEENTFVLELWRKYRDEKTWFESNFWRTMSLHSRVPFVYIGLNDIDDNGNFKWSDGTPYDFGQDMWLPRNPITANSKLGMLEDGVMIWDRKSNMGKWNDVNSRSRHLRGPSICKAAAR